MAARLRAGELDARAYSFALSVGMQSTCIFVRDVRSFVLSESYEDG